jgi:CHASE2 domain-containing sensor protein
VNDTPGKRPQTPPGRGRRLVRALLAVVLTVAFFLLTFRSKEMFELESVARDFAARSRVTQPLDTLVIVSITDSDYSTLFGARSPLAADTLARLLRAIAAGKPRIIGVDIETSDSSFSRLRPLNESIQREGTKLAWARDGVPVEGHEGLAPFGVLGGKEPHDADGVHSGIAATALDERGTVRTYRQRVPVGETTAPSFAAAIDGSSAGDTSTRFIAFHQGSSAAWNITAAQLLALTALPDSGQRLLKNKIVLLGGSYRAGRDEHHTPIGVMSGLAIQAQMLETELQGGGAKMPSVWMLGALQLLAGSMVVLLIFHLAPTRAALAVILSVPAFSLIGSRLITGSWVDGLPYFVPLLVLLVIHQLYEKANFYRELLLRALYDHARGHDPEAESASPLIERTEGAIEGAIGRMRGA